MNIKEITDYIFIGTEPCKADAIFVVGGSLPDAARLAADANAGSLIITHLNPFWPVRTLLQEARAVFPRVRLAEAGAVIDL